MSIHCDKTFLMVPNSRSPVKVKVEYQGHISQKLAVAGALVFHRHRHLVFFFLAHDSVASYRESGILTLSQTTNFKLFQIERVCRRQFQIW